MNQEECKEIKQALDLFLNESLERILMSNPTDSGKISRSRIRPLLMKAGWYSRRRNRRESRHFTAIWTGMRRQIMSLGFWTDPSARRRLHPALERPLYW
mgnify:CR=1 FL=1